LEHQLIPFCNQRNLAKDETAADRVSQFYQIFFLGCGVEMRAKELFFFKER
jgi:hypothetical protein